MIKNCLRAAILCITMIVVPSVGYATILGIERVSAFSIYNSGAFSYSNDIQVYNDLNEQDSFSGNWLFFTDDLGSITTSGLTFTSDFTPWEGWDPWNGGVWRTGFTRDFRIDVASQSYHTYSIAYDGPAGFWNFGGDEGVYYGDGNGGAETPLNDFDFTLTLPSNATEYSIIDESSPHTVMGTDPFVLNWHETNVTGIVAELEFRGNLDTIPEPSTALLLGLGILGAGFIRHRRSS